MTTIKEIARIAEVSSSTVSRVLRKDVSFSIQEETRRKIIEVARTLNYRTKQNRKLVGAEQSMDSRIGLVIWCSEQFEFSDPFYMTIRQGIERECAKRGISIHRIFRWIEDESPALDFTGLNGVIVIGKVDSDMLPQPSYSEVPIVYIDHQGSDSYDSVQFNIASAAKQALAHLLQLGYRRIGYIGGTSYVRKQDGIHYIEDERQTAYTLMMRERGWFHEDSVFVGSWGAEEGYRLMKQAIQQGNLPEAFFIASDPMAIGALRALDESGIKVPEQVGIVSIDDIDLAQYVTPPLTTVKVYTEEMGVTAVKLLIDRLLGRVLPFEVTVPTALIIRHSCGGSMQKEVVAPIS
ncbi:LacI family DNA-binding transcriptional regulator [Paenibacillus guangzhouensis]|uniref:LacI family DNA-binding transcriptional regulator n=1 Tax=Paenibacillus guangzhouensis TaxID=1473112 RepID=UPI001267761B|nr:LacI family DNA-binding transcriptional regulator [Paenibacillus guangzhouensis]